MRQRCKWIAALTVATLAGLATSARADLWGISVGDNLLLNINPLTAEATFVDVTGDFSLVDFSGLDYMNGTLYANGMYSESEDDYGLVSINPVTGETSFLNYDPIPFNSANALGGDPLTNRLYSFEAASGFFFYYDGASDYQPIPLFDLSNDLAWVDGGAFGFDLFWGVDSFTQSLYTINPYTGAVNFRGEVSIPLSDDAGLAWDNGVLYLSSADENEISSLYTLNPDTAEATLIGAITASGDGLLVTGLAGTIPSFAPEPASCLLILPALVGMGIARRRRNQMA